MSDTVEPKLSKATRRATPVTRGAYSDAEMTFVHEYCRIGDPRGTEAARIAKNGLKGYEAYFLTRARVRKLIEEYGGPEPIIITKPLTAIEHAWVDKYFETLNNVKFAEQIGIDTDSVNNWVIQPHIAEEIRKRTEELRLRSIVKCSDVIEELACIAFSDITDYCSFNSQGIQLKDSESMPNTGAIAEVTQTQHGVKLKLHSKMTALETVAKYLGLFKERLEISGPNGGPIEIESPLSSLNRKLDALAAKHGTDDVYDADVIDAPQDEE